MFGGYGIYHDGLMFGLVENDILYLKADESTKNILNQKTSRSFSISVNPKW